jgi:hypothetical protein
VKLNVAFDIFEGTETYKTILCIGGSFQAFLLKKIPLKAAIPFGSPLLRPLSGGVLAAVIRSRHFWPSGRPLSAFFTLRFFHFGTRHLNCPFLSLANFSILRVLRLLWQPFHSAVEQPRA